jgi:Cysteine dioxygenase type I
MTPIGSEVWSSLLAQCKQGHPLSEASLQTLSETVARHRVPIGEGEPYGRIPVCLDESGEVLLVSWSRGIRCAPHDHAGASGTLILLHGTFHERRFIDTPEGPSLLDERVLKGPTQVAIPAGTIHDMLAPSGGLSVHCYWPALNGMSVFDFARRETLTLTQDCGAWLPWSDDCVLARKPWIS